jgi:hypothetical protein
MPENYNITFDPASPSTLIEYKKEGETTWTTPSVPANPTSLSTYPLVLDTGSTYYVRVTAIENDCPNISTIITIVTSPIHDSFYFEASSLVYMLSGALTLTTTDGFEIDWGDGVIDMFGAGSFNPTHEYDGSYTGNITISSANLGGITSLHIGSDTEIGPLTGALSILTSEINKLTGLQNLNMGFNIFVDGVVSDLNEGLMQIIALDTNLSGTTAELPRSLTYIYITGANTISGDVIDFPPDLYFLILYGSNTITGNLVDIPRTVIVMYVEGNNTINGNISNVPPNITDFELKGTNTVTGDVAGLPSSVSILNIVGNNTISGNLSSLPAGLIVLILQGNSTITGNLVDVPSGVTFLQITGSGNTVSGMLSNIPSGVFILNLIGTGCAVSGYTSPRVWPSTMDLVNLIPDAGGFTTTEVDNILIDLATYATTWTDYKSINIPNSSRTSASDAAVATLVSRGVTITTL